MIIIGYPGIGLENATAPKSEYGFTNGIYISPSLFKGYENGISAYVNLAIGLSKRGYCVTIDAIPEIYEKLTNAGERVAAIYPSDTLKDIWTEREGISEEFFIKQIEELRALPFEKEEITGEFYSLRDIIFKIVHKPVPWDPDKERR